MPVTQLADVIVPDFYANYGGINSMTSTALFQSGALVGNPLVEGQLSQGGDILNVPAWNDLAAATDAGGSEPNLSNDSPTTLAIPQKLTAVNHLLRKAYLNNGWSAADFAVELAGSDPMVRIAERIQAYWARQYEYRLAKSLYGILLSNVAQNASDMVTDISAATTGAPVVINGTSYTAPNISRNAVIDAVTTIGDRFADFTAIAMHSSVYREAAKADQIEYVRDSDNNILFSTYAGLAVTVDDNLSLAGGNFITVLFGNGAIGFAEADSGKVPVEIFRWPSQGNGAGVEEVWHRRVSSIAPFGFSFTSASVAGASPSGAELATAGNWSRIVPRKNTPLAFLVSK